MGHSRCGERGRLRAAALAWIGIALAALLPTGRCEAVGFIATGSLQTSRVQHAATQLPSGKVLVVGGSHPNYLASAELYDPATGTWSSAGSLAVARGSLASALLPDGSVLVAGGNTNAGETAASERYDAASNSWVAAAPLPAPRTAHTMTALASGKVLVVGGIDPTNTVLASAYLYDPANDTWSAAGSLASPRFFHTAVRLASGNVLVAGGYANDGPRSATTELYDPATNRWTSAGTLPNGVVDLALTPLASGGALATGGDAFEGRVADATVYDEATNTWRPTAPMARARNYHSATQLPSGKVLVVGGYDFPTVIDTAELYDPDAETWMPAGTLLTGRLIHSAHLLPSGRVLIVAGRNVSGPLASAELFAPETTTTITSVSPPETLPDDPYVVDVEVDGVSGVPTGTVTVSDGNGGGCESLDLVGGFASCTMTSDVVGLLPLTATFEPDDGAFASSFNTVMHEVDPFDVDVAITAATPEPSVVGQPVSVAFAVTGGGAPPTGTVTIAAGVTGETCTADVADGACVLVFAVDGPRALTATYSGDAMHRGGDSPPLTHDVVEADTTLAIVSHDPDPSLPFEAVTVTAQLAVVPPGSGTPHSSISVGDGVASCLIFEGDTSCDLTLTTRGLHTITATYGGDGDFNPSTTSVSHRVNELPVVADAHYSTLEEAPLQVDAAGGVLAGSSDPDGDVLSVVNAGTFKASGIGGIVELQADGSFAYTPPARGVGKDTFGFEVSDGYESVFGNAVVTVTAAANVSVTIDDGETFAPGGSVVAYTIVVANAGPGDANGARVRDIVPANLDDATWSCIANAGATCSASGSGDIDDVVDLAIGATSTYVLTATVAIDLEVPVVNTASVVAPAGVTDTNPLDDSATDIDATGIFRDGFDTLETKR
jgi:uncharacterized repeat protein (TIGR01451 family)